MRLIGDILDLNRIQAGELIPEQTSLSVRELLQKALQSTKDEATGRLVTVAAEASLRVIGDEPLLRQALVNLIENALRYSQREGAVRLTARRQAGYVEIDVVDEGPGIPQADLPHIFERHFRSSVEDRGVRGSGLGLTIVKSFVEICGGSIGVESSPAGTAFRIRLPAESKSHVPA
jgi:signal transduction histidine kinase